MVALSGVVVNDSLVLMDQYTRNRERNGRPNVNRRSPRHRWEFSDHGDHGPGSNAHAVRNQHSSPILIPMAVSLQPGSFSPAYYLVLDSCASGHSRRRQGLKRRQYHGCNCRPAEARFASMCG